MSFSNTNLESIFDQCNDDLKREFKRTIQSCLLSMINGSSSLIRMLHYFSQGEEPLKETFEKLTKKGKIGLWMSTFHNLSAKVKFHFDTLQILLLDLMTDNEVMLSEHSDSEAGFKEIQSTIMQNFDLIYPTPSAIDSKNFFIRSLCEDSNTYYFDEEYLKDKGLVNCKQRKDGKGMKVVSQSIAKEPKIRIKKYNISINGKNSLGFKS